jgi:hypothetical protein
VSVRRIDPRILIGVAVGVVVLAAAVLVLGGDDGADEGPSVPRSEFYGVNAPELRVLATPELSEALDAHAREISDRGIGWARIAFGQKVEQPVPGPIDWSAPDEFVSAFARHGVRTAAVFIGTATWAASPQTEPQCGSKAAPADARGWAAFLGAAAARYGPDGEFWEENPELPQLPILDFEVGNEPNTAMFWCPAADPEQYATVYRAAHDAILDANPEARPVLGGLAPNFDHPTPGNVPVPEFLRRMLAADPALADQIPAVAIHPYGPTPEFVIQSIRAFRVVLRDVGLGETPMIANETGWYTQGPLGTRYADDEARTRFVGEIAAVADRTDCGLERFGIHAWTSNERLPDFPNDWFGIADPRTGAPRDAAIAYGRAISGEDPAEAGALARTASNVCSS